MRCLSDSDIQQWLDGELAGLRKGKLEEHLGDCPRCRQLADRMKTEAAWIQRKLAGLNPDKIPLGDLPQFQEPLAAPQRWLGWMVRPVRVPALALFLMILIAAALGIALWRQQQTIDRLQAKAAPKPAAAQTILVMKTGNSIQTVSLDLDLSRCRMLKEPKIMVVKEASDEAKTN